MSLLKTHPHFRSVFVARFISILALGLLNVAVPVQIQHLTQSTFQVGLALTLTASSMFFGLMLGGVFADRYERKRLILIARFTCGVGFIGLWLNALLPAPSIITIYLLGIWDGFFGALGVTALLAATPFLVGKENLLQSNAIIMLTVRLGAVISPMIGGLILAQGGVVWNYALASAGTFLTLLPLFRLPVMAAPQNKKENPFLSLLTAIRFLLSNPIVGGAALIGAFITLATAVRVLYPALAGHWQMDDNKIGFLYAALPFGAALGALTSGGIAHNPKPGLLLITTSIGAFFAIALFAMMPNWLLALGCLAAFGYLSGLSSLLQYTLIQTETPDHMLGRINGLWTAQNVTGEAIGAALLGTLGTLMTPASSAIISGWTLIIISLILFMLLKSLKQYQSISANIRKIV